MDGKIFRTVLYNVEYAIKKLNLYDNIGELNKDLGFSAVSCLTSGCDEEIHKYIKSVLSVLHVTEGFVFADRDNVVPNITPLNFMISNLAWQIMYDDLELYVNQSEYYECSKINEKVSFLLPNLVYKENIPIKSGIPVVMNVSNSIKVVAYINTDRENQPERFLDIYVKQVSNDSNVIVRSFCGDLPASKDLYEAVKETGILEKRKFSLEETELLISKVLR